MNGWVCVFFSNICQGVYYFILFSFPVLGEKLVNISPKKIISAGFFVWFFFSTFLLSLIFYFAKNVPPSYIPLIPPFSEKTYIPSFLPTTQSPRFFFLFPLVFPLTPGYLSLKPPPPPPLNPPKKEKKRIKEDGNRYRYGIYLFSGFRFGILFGGRGVKELQRGKSWN